MTDCNKLKNYPTIHTLSDQHHEEHFDFIYVYVQTTKIIQFSKTE